MTAAAVGLRCFRNEEDRKTVRGTVFPTNAIQFCLTIKALFKLPLRQATGMVASLLKMAGLDWAVPGHTTLCRRQKTLAVHPLSARRWLPEPRHRRRVRV